SKPGGYTVTLTVTGAAGTAYETRTNYIRVASVAYTGTAEYDEYGTGIGYGHDAVYVCGYSSGIPDPLLGPGNRGVFLRYNVPHDNDVQPSRIGGWPYSGTGSNYYRGITVGEDGVYVVGESYCETADGVGAKEEKSILLKYPLDFMDPTWYSWYRNLGGSTAFETLAGCVSEYDNGNNYIYAVGMAQSPEQDLIVKVIDPVTKQDMPLGADGGTEDYAPIQPGWPQKFTSTGGGSHGYSITLFKNCVYAAGSSYDDDALRPVIVKYSKNGVQQWIRRGDYNFLYKGLFRTIISYGNALYVAGQVNEGVGSSTDFVIEKWDEAGNKIWSKQYDRSSQDDVIYSIVGIGTKIYAVGSTRGGSSGGLDVAILEIDCNTGDLASTKLFGGSNNDIARGAATNGKDLYITGETSSFGSGGKDFFFISVPSLVDVVFVDGTNGSDTNNGYSWEKACKTIQQGITAAEYGWTVYVADGTYKGAGNKELNFSGKTVTLKSVGGPTKCIIDCENDGRGFHFTLGEPKQTIIEGFTIKNGNAKTGGGGIRCFNSNPTIKRCIITSCTANADDSYAYGGGIYCGYASPAIINCIIVGNISADAGGGVHCFNSNPIIINSTIADNTATNVGGGISCNTECNPVLYNTILWGNGSTSGSQIYTEDEESRVGLSNSCFENGTGDINGLGEVTFSNSINSNPLFIDTSINNYHLQATSSCIDAGNNFSIPSTCTLDIYGNTRISNDTIDIGAHETKRITVPAQYSTIQAALDAAGDGDTIVLSSGTHSGVGNRNIDFKGKAVYLKSVNKASTCTIDCGYSGRAFYFHSGESSLTTVEGITIKNGDSIENGGGVFCRNNSNPTFINCVLTNNSSSLSGGAFYLDNSAPALINCVIVKNTATEYGGAIYCLNSSSRITNCTIADNSALGTSDGGGGIFVTGVGPTLDNTILWSNTAASTKGNEIFVANIDDAVTLNFCNCTSDDVEGGTIIYNGAVEGDPLFTNAENSVYTLQLASPCIDAGNNSYISIDIDINNNTRIVDADGDETETVDIGAYEYQP
ncbi:MAG: choice-of-anchor Q domain-containing protein, partial [Planctomycetota bacterium]